MRRVEVEWVLGGEEQWREVVDYIVKHCPEVRVFALYGELGSGKTTFVRHFLGRLGCKDAVHSPTFTLINAYEVNGQLAYHIDLFRTRSALEWLDIGVDELFEGNNYVFIEWPQQIEKLLPKSITLAIFIEVQEDHTRRVRLKSLAEEHD